MEVKKNDTVTVDYEGKLENGEVFDSSKKGDEHHPLTFVAGVGQVVAGFDAAVLGMKKGEEKEVTLSPDQAYGERNKELEQKVPRRSLKMDKEPEAGMMLGLSTPDGRQAAVQIIAVDKESITVDLNPPLAGKTLIFKIKVLEIKSEK